MTVLVPFDGSALATAALEKAAEYADLLEEDVVALTVIPDDADYARERGWIARGEPFDADVISEAMRERVTETAPSARFRSHVVDSDEPTATPARTVVRTVRRVADELDASVVFVGTENAGSVTTPLSSVGGPVAGDQGYDVYVVRHAE